MPSAHDPTELYAGPRAPGAIHAELLSTVWRPAGLRFRALFLVALAGAVLLAVLVAYSVTVGLGLWGIQIPVAWGFAIVNFVWWIGIGHAGTLISAILLLLEQKWRTSINRFAEAMTLFAVLNAAIFPLLHMGRPWFFYWLVPYPSTLRAWPQFRSPLTWDVAAVSTYFLVSLLFWYVGLLPDLAALRDGAPGRTRRIVYGIFSLGWRGSARHWEHWRALYTVLAGLATPLVLSVHTVVSFDFAVAHVPGWHSTIFPPYFVAGAIFSGFAMVLVLLIPARRALRLEAYITPRHLEKMALVTLATGTMVAYAYLVEHFIAWYGGFEPEMYQFFHARPRGWHASVFWLLVACNVLAPQVFWLRRARTSTAVIFLVAVLINVGMWAERFIIVVVSLERGFVPALWRRYEPTWVDWGILLGTLGFFAALFLLFLRYVPAVAASEVKELAHELGAHRGPARPAPQDPRGAP